MPWLTSKLPWADSPSPMAAQCSYNGVVAAQERAGTQVERLLELYAKRGPTSDWEAHKALGWERTTVNARRRPLCQRGIVVAVDTVKNADTGISNTRWGLA